MRALFALCCGCAVALAAGMAAAAPHNVVLIVSDDQGLDLSCYGHPVLKTPHLDALAAEGTRFTHAYCTTSSCSASRSVILTGLYNHTNGQYGHQHASHNFHTHTWVKSLPLLLSQAGYRTCSIGKLHVQPASVYAFDVFANEGIDGGAHNPVGMAENARKFIQSCGEEKFFLYFCPADPHRTRGGFGNERNYPGVEPVRFDPKEVAVPPFLPDTPECRAELAEYYGACARLDQGVGRLMQVLRETGRWDDTLVIFLSDNGIPFPGAKTNLYDSGARLPLIIRSPQQKRRGVACDAVCNFTNIAPTILEFCGVQPPPYGLPGKSLLGVLDQEHPEGFDETYLSHTFHEITMYYPVRAVVTRQHKYLFNIAAPLPFPFASDLYACATWQGVLRRGDKMYGKRSVEAYIHRSRHELYDLQEDPDEVRNLAEDAAHAKLLSQMQEKVRRFQQQTKDPWLLKWTYE